MSFDDFDDDLTVPMRQTSKPPLPPPQPQPQPQQPSHRDHFDDDLTVPVRQTNQSPPPLAVEVRPPDRTVAPPGDAPLWTPPSRPIRSTTGTEPGMGFARWKLIVAGALVAAVAAAAVVLLVADGDGDGDNGQATEARVETS